MEFKWDNKNIEKDIMKLEKKAQQEINLEKKYYYLKIINYTKSILQSEKISTIRPYKTKLETIINLNSNYLYKERYYDLINIFYNNIKKNRELLATTLENCDKIGNLSTSGYIENEDALTIMQEFFKNNSGDLYKYFKEIYEKRHETIRFSLTDICFEQFGLDGCCTYIDILRKNYILIRNDEGISKLVNLAHECGHAISNLYYPKSVYNRPDEFLAEVPSIFFELVFNYETGKQIDSFESSLLNIEKIEYFSQIAYNLEQHKAIINEWEKNNYKIDNNMYQALKEKNKLTRTQINDSINTDIESDGQYITGYMTALELFSIYKQDKKSALQLLKKLIKQDEKDSIGLLMKYITFDNIEKEIEIQETEMNKELLKKIK